MVCASSNPTNVSLLYPWLTFHLQFNLLIKIKLVNNHKHEQPPCIYNTIVKPIDLAYTSLNTGPQASRTAQSLIKSSNNMATTYITCFGQRKLANWLTQMAKHRGTETYTKV
jgi:hypothetical protein